MFFIARSRTTAISFVVLSWFSWLRRQRLPSEITVLFKGTKEFSEINALTSNVE